MPGQRPWITRIPEIIQHIEARPRGFFLERKDLEALFGVGRSAAGELMHAAGGVADGKKGMLISELRLLHYLHTGPEAKSYQREVRRRQLLADRLNQAAAENRRRSVKIPANRSEEWLRLKDLPGIRIAPGELRVEFVGGSRELTARLFQLSKAIANDWDRFSQLCGGE